MSESILALWAVPVAMLGGAIRYDTFIFVSLASGITEARRINLGLEGLGVRSHERFHCL